MKTCKTSVELLHESIACPPQADQSPKMALVSGPGRGGNVNTKSPPGGMRIVVEKHVDYIRKLDTVRHLVYTYRIMLMDEAEER